MYAEFNERAEAATSSYFVTDDFLQDIYSVLMTENHQNIQSWCLAHEFSCTYIFNNIVMVTEQLIEETFMVTTSVLYG